MWPPEDACLLSGQPECVSLTSSSASRKKKVQGISENAAEKVEKGQIMNMVQFKLRQLDFVLELMDFRPEGQGQIHMSSLRGSFAARFEGSS